MGDGARLACSCGDRLTALGARVHRPNMTEGDGLPRLFAWMDDIEGPRSWQELDLDQLGFSPPRQRGMYHADGQPWTQADGLLIFATGADMRAWDEAATKPGR